MELGGVEHGICRILVIDDNPAIHEDFTKILTGDCGTDPDLDGAERMLFGTGTPRRSMTACCIDSAYQGDEGLSLVRESVREGDPYTIAFVDMRMPPGWDGMETIERLWREDRELQVVICTAYSDYSWREIYDRFGESDQLLIIKKPFDSVEIRQVVCALAERHCRRAVSKVNLAALEQMVEDRTRTIQSAALELQRSEERFRQIAEHLDDVLWLTDSQGLIYVNPAYEKIWGRAPVQAKHLWAEGVHEDDEWRVRDAIDKSERGERFEEIYRVLRPEGAVRWIRSRGFPIVEASGGIIRIAGVAQDITDLKHAESQLGEAEKLEAIGRLAAGVAHEINTPLQFISDNTRFLQGGFGDLLEAVSRYREAMVRASDGNAEEADRIAADLDWTYLSVEIPQALEQSLEGLNRVTGIVRAMKEFSHPRGDKFVHMDLNRAIESTITVSRNEWKYVADLETDLDPQLPEIPCLPGAINQVLLNLVINSAHAIEDVPARPGKGRIVISTRAIDDQVEVRVSDTGTGIPDDVKAKVFEPFFTTKEVGRGTGQGLAIARNVVVNKHGGSIEIESEPGIGTTIVFRLPIWRQEEDDRDPR